MTRELGDLGEELEALYGEGLRDLTFHGYTRASQQLRNDDPAMARRVDRRLDPFLRTKVFPRRRREWQETSEGTRARLALLAENPHLERDVRDVRSVLGVPDSQVRVLEGDDLWNQAAEVVRPECVRQEVERQLVGGWHLIHLQAALGRELDEDIAGMVSAEMRESAQESARVRFDVDEIPNWLQTSSDGPVGYRGPIVPLNWAAHRLIQRHRLPRRASAALTAYVLTENPQWLIGLDPLDVNVVSGAHLSDEGEPFSVHVGSIDE